jgi:cell division protein FtsW (lipid II flippase)
MRRVGSAAFFVAALAAMWWAGLKLMAVLVTVVCGLAGLAYLVTYFRQPPPPHRAEREQDRHDVERYLP